MEPTPEPNSRRLPVPRLMAGLGLFVAGLLLGGAAIYYGMERPALAAAQARMTQLELDLAAARGHVTRTENMIAALEGRLGIEESTRRGLEMSLRTAQEELGRAQDTVAFYEQLMPPGPKGTVSIRAIDFEPVGPHLKYRVLLMRSGSSNEPFKGRLQFEATGMMGEARESIVLETARAPAPSRKLDEGASHDEQVPEPSPDDAGTQDAGDPAVLEFADFQRSSGVLSLPEGFTPESVTVSVLEGDTLRTSRKVELPAAE